ncbi:MAG: hypothetical protein WC794_06915, partial [Candidatus Doudnabacteria bacterium]
LGELHIRALPLYFGNTAGMWEVLALDLAEPGRNSYGVFLYSYRELPLVYGRRWLGVRNPNEDGTKPHWWWGAD